MPEITVQPTEFAMVNFDASTIEALATELATDVGLDQAASVRIDVDETVPLGRHVVDAVDPIVLAIEGGALENSKAPRQFDATAATDVLGRLLFEAADRGSDAFGAPGDELSLEHRTAWDVYNAGRINRLRGLGQRQRWLYAFRTRHGFTDEADSAFDELWNAEDLTWADVEALSTRAGAAAPV